jgi:hypothetical protein
MGELRVGDRLVDPLASPSGSRVLAIFYQGPQPVYRIIFSDGSMCEATPDHLWPVQAHTTAFGYLPVTATTEQLRLRVQEVFGSPRTRLIEVQVRLGGDLIPVASHRELVSVQYIRTTPVQCIAVSAPSSLYFTDNYIPTHNTTVRKAR